MSKTKGIYIFSISPFRQRAFAGFGKEMAGLAKQHWQGSLYFGGLLVGAWWMMKWANNYYHHSIRKDPAFYEQEALALAQAAESTPTTD